MKLRTKFFLITAAATVLPIATATLIGRELVERRSRLQFARRLREAEREVRTRYRTMREQLARSVERIADADDRYIGRILLGLVKGDVDEELPLLAPQVMRERGLDLLTITDVDGNILACGHFPGRAGERIELPPLDARREPALGRERVLEHGQASTRLALQAWRSAHSTVGGGAKLWVMGGRYLDQRFVRGLRLEEGTRVRIRDAAGNTLAAPRAGWARFAGYPQREVRLGAAPGAKATGATHALVTLAVSDDRLHTALQVISYVAYALIAGALLLAVLLGWLATRITRPLEGLARTAEEVAAGELDRQLPVRSRDEVGELVASFNRMTEQLRESRVKLVAAERIAAWQEIARRIAHEIKNPLSPIRTSIETLRKAHDKQHPTFEEIFDESTTTILDEVQRMRRILDEFSRFARMPKPRFEPIEVDEWLRTTTGLYGDEQIQIRCRIEDSLPTLQGDREQLTQVAINLIHNARDAGAGNPVALEITARAAGDGLELVFADDGPGFDEQTAAQLFTPYFTTKRGRGGSGLGLPICQRIITEHGGSIEARGAPGDGATITIRLPLHR